MKVQELKNKCADISKKVAVKVASHYADVACPYFTYQPKVTYSIKSLRKF